MNENTLSEVGAICFGLITIGIAAFILDTPVIALFLGILGVVLVIAGVKSFIGLPTAPYW